jgi:hypothetical protein
MAARKKYKSVWHSPDDQPEQRNPNFPNGDWLVRILMDRKDQVQMHSVIVPYKNWQRVREKYPDMRAWCYLEDLRNAVIEEQ